MAESMDLDREAVAPELIAQVRAAFLAYVTIYQRMRASLYATLCARIAEDPALLALASHGMEGARPTHFLSAIHYLLLGDPADPLARYFLTIDPDPLPPEGAFAELQRFAGAHEGAIRELLETRTVQTTYVERCVAVAPLMAWIADRAGEPLNLVEIGCSAGVLLTFDKYAYAYAGRDLVGPADAPVTLSGALNGGPALRIPQIGSRIGLDLHIFDMDDETNRRWLLALCFPELREEQARLATALETIRRTPIRFLEGDAMVHLATVLEETPTPLCVFHSACLFYWDRPSKQRLEELLLEKGRGRDIWRLAIEPSERFDEWHKGREVENQAEQPPAAQPSGEIVVSLYRGGEVERWTLARISSDYTTVDWIEGAG